MTAPDAPAERPAAVQPPASDTRLHGPWLRLAQGVRLALTGLTLVLFLVAVPTFAAGPRLPVLGPLLTHYPAAILVIIAADVAVMLAFAATSAILFWRKTDDWLMIFISATLVTLGATLTISFVDLAHTPSAWGWAAAAVITLSYAGAFILFYLFPDGRVVPRWARWMVAFHVVWALAQLVFPVVHPITWPRSLLVPVVVGLLSLVVAAQVYRYRRVSTPLQRQQTKGIVFGMAAVLVGYAVAVAPQELFPSLTEPGLPAFLYLVLISVPFFHGPRIVLAVAIGAAMVRYRLWDIDLIIRRTLIYSVLTGALVVVYVASVALLQYLLRPLLGQGNELAIIASTLAIAALFNPLRQRIQAFIDQRFYRRTYDAARVLAAFSARLRDETDLEQLAEDVLDVVQATMQPTHVSLWLRPLDRARPSPPEQAEP